MDQLNKGDTSRRIEEMFCANTIHLRCGGGKEGWRVFIVLRDAQSTQLTGTGSSLEQALRCLTEEISLWLCKNGAARNISVNVKPPLGIMPEQIWKEGRVWDLIECLARHRHETSIPGGWFGELRRLLGEIRTPNTTVEARAASRHVPPMTFRECMEAEEMDPHAEWRSGDYAAGRKCPKCGRVRVCLCLNGKHRCEKCNWCPEDNVYVPREF